MATLEARVPVLFFFDGFRTSHEENKISLIPDEQITGCHRRQPRARAPCAGAHTRAARHPGHDPRSRHVLPGPRVGEPLLHSHSRHRPARDGPRGALTGRSYRLFRYSGHPEADRAVVVIGSAFEVLDETAAWLTRMARRSVSCRWSLYRPWDAAAFSGGAAVTVKRIAVLDRTKEIGGPGEPLYLDVLTTFAEALAAGQHLVDARDRGRPLRPVVEGLRPRDGQDGLRRAEEAAPKRGFTVGINDDVSHTSLAVDASFDIEPPDVVRALFYGLGADGTVGANKNSTIILAADPNRHAQGYFVYDSKKSGLLHDLAPAVRPPARSARRTSSKSANFVGIHKFDFLYKLDTLGAAAPGATVLINSPYSAR